MNPDLGQPIGHREIIRQINAQKAAEAKAAGAKAVDQETAGEQHNTEQPQEPRCRITAFRHETTGQFYAMSLEDSLAFKHHCEGIVHDLQPANHRESWLATAIAEDQWRLSRARALESNIFAIGMSHPIIETEGGSPETQAAISQARVWLADGKKLQMLALYEQRIRRSIEKNEKQLRELQTERKHEYNKALQEEILLAQLAIVEGEVYSYNSPQAPAGSPAASHSQNGFEFSTADIIRLAHRELRLRRAARQAKTCAPLRREGPVHTPKAA